MEITIEGIVALVSAIAYLLGTPTIIALVNRRQLHNEIGETGDSTLADKIDGIHTSVLDLRDRVERLESYRMD